MILLVLAALAGPTASAPDSLPRTTRLLREAPAKMCSGREAHSLPLVRFSQRFACPDPAALARLLLRGFAPGASGSLAAASLAMNSGTNRSASVIGPPFTRR